MIDRYTPQEFADLWSEKTKYETWFDVEIAACHAMEHAGIVPAGTADEIKPIRGKIDPHAILEIEKKTKHDVIAFLTHIEQLAGAPARWLHRGMTSSDVLDSSLALLMKRACGMLLGKSEGLLAALKTRCVEHRRTPMIGRSHGIFAEPVSFGLVLAGHFAELKRCHQRLGAAMETISHGKIAGAVGTYAHLSPSIERQALASLGLLPETVSTQVVARDRHADFVCTLGIYAGCLERLATNVRHWQRSEVREAEESFSAGQKGSSAMPHKRNPVLSENICGLSRWVRAAVTPSLENIALWHERDISHSSVERMAIPDATTTLAFMIQRSTQIVENLAVNIQQLQANLEQAKGLWASEGVLLQLVNKGLGRQKAYELVQGHAMKAFFGEGNFQQLLINDPSVTEHLDANTIANCFSLDHALSHVDIIIQRALED